MFQLLLKMDDLESEFNLKVVLVSFKQCLNEKEEVLLEYYLAGWRGLVRCARGFPGHTSHLYPVGPVHQGIFLTQGLKSRLLCLLHCRQILYC